MTPAVSILIPVYNAREWLAAAVESALAQTSSNVEVVVLDDGSTDGSYEVAERFAGRVHLARQSNGGQNVSRNQLTAMSRGEWLVYLDADDELAPDAVEKKLARADAADVVFGTMNLQHYRGAERLRTESFPASDYPDPFAAAFLWKYPNTSSFMFRRSAVDAVGGWNEAIRSCTDYDLYFRLLLAGKRFSAAPESVSIYRHWSARQASLEDTFRQTTTRLDVMWRAAGELDRNGPWTPASRDAFANAALGVIRILHMVNADRAAAEFDRLHAWDPQLRPAPAFFSSSYRAAFRLLGFRGAERVADATRALKPGRLPVATHSLS
jgi:glycosyltransferase involved in cell wall biosynthesis